MAGVSYYVIGCLLLAACVSVQGVDSNKAAVAIDSDGQVHQQAKVSTERKSMVRQAKAGKEGKDFAVITFGCGRFDSDHTHTQCMEKTMTKGTLERRGRPMKLGFRCCKKDELPPFRLVAMHKYGCGSGEKNTCGKNKACRKSWRKKNRRSCKSCKGETFAEAKEYCEARKVPKDVDVFDGTEEEIKAHCAENECDALTLCTFQQLDSNSECEKSWLGCKEDKMQLWTSDEKTKNECEAEGRAVVEDSLVETGSEKEHQDGSEEASLQAECKGAEFTECKEKCTTCKHCVEKKGYEECKEECAEKDAEKCEATKCHNNLDEEQCKVFCNCGHCEKFSHCVQ